MKQRELILFIMFLLLASLACQSLNDTGEPAATATAVMTPTLAPTTTPDPNVTPVTAAGDGAVTGEAVSGGTVDAAAPTDGASGDGVSASGTPAPGAGTNEASPSGGDSGGGEATEVAPVAAGGCPASGQNLLLNPSFEGQYKPFGAFNELNHAPNWFPWWQDGQNNLRPEFKPADIAIAPNRVHGGSLAQQYFKSFGQFKAGLYQSVLNVPAGSRLQFSAHGQAWSCEEFNMCPNGTSVNPANMLMRVGIDPTGDTSFLADTIVWSAYFNPLDQWQVACVEAVAERDIVTVYLWASPDGPRQNQDVYWDDASLVVIP